MKIFFFVMVAILITSCNFTQKKPLESTNHMFTTDQSEISYFDCGEGEITLLFVHGWNIDKSYWRFQEKQFCGRYRVVSMDLPGFGGSRNIGGIFSIDSYGKDVNALITQLDLANVVLIGHSMGGRVILEAAQSNGRVIGLVGVDNFKEVSQKLTPELQAEITGFMEWLATDFTNNSPAYADQFLIHPEADSLVRKRILKSYSHGNQESAMAALEAYLSYSFQEQERLSQLNVPLFLISSNMSPVDTAGLKNTGLNYEVFEMERSGHFPMVEQPKLFNELLRKALIQIPETLQNEPAHP